MMVKKGDKVRVEYEGTFEDGEVFDSSKNHGKPLEFELGAKQVIPGFESAIEEMKVGEEKSIKIESKDGYGEVNAQLIQKVPKEHLPKDQEVKEGMMLAVGLPNGQQIPARVSQVSDKEVTLDLNHPLAGKTLNFKLKLLEIVK
ncbi:peptidylprolyl isomerase [Candidatus Woesearchaeota archaeon]|nr:peptidylprolyl isomerase [Candidatus Woesearchaeota archaeon]